MGSTTSNEWDRSTGRANAVRWGIPFAVGLLTLAAGILCFIAAEVTGLASILVFGWLLLVSGVLEVVHAFRRRTSGQFLLYFLGGLLSLVVGGLFVGRPLVGLASLTLLLAGYFFASGLFRGVTSLMDRYQGWGWDCFSGLVSVVLGAILIAQWPASSLWLVGVLVAVEIITHGVAMMAAALTLRSAQRTISV